MISRSASKENTPKRTASRAQALSEANREFSFDQKDFDFIAGLIKTRAGIVLNETKINMVYGRLSRRLRALGMTNFGEYCNLVSSPQGKDELMLFTNSLTTNLTKFFREAHHFEHMTNHLLPDVVSHAEKTGKRRLRIWSAGSSSGEEPYTIAMTVLDCIQDIQRWDARILATDIDTHMLQTSRRGIYTEERIENIPPRLQKRFVHPSSEEPGKFQMSHQLQSMIAFKPLNLLERWPMKGPFDAIFCRNVIIYFDRETQKDLVDRYADLLAPGGILYVGHSESLFDVSKRFKLLGQSIYQKL